MGNIIEYLEAQVKCEKECSFPNMDGKSWIDQSGVIITVNDAIKILKHLKK